jgi:hypothetical protein
MWNAMMGIWVEKRERMLRWNVKVARKVWEFPYHKVRELG